MSEKIKIICLVGATATGKTEAALHLARTLSGAVINFDSRQVYADLPIITAQPSAEEQAVCPHFLYGYLPSQTKIKAGSFVPEIEAAIRKVIGQGLIPILVGGTGLYLKSLLQGLAPIPDVDKQISQKIKQECLELGSSALYKRLQKIDPDYADKIHPNDKQRICRALEVFFATGREFSNWHKVQADECKYEYLKLGLWRSLDDLTPDLGLRIDKMKDIGAVQEMRTALRNCPDCSAPAYNGIGCPELIAYLQQDIDWDECRRLWLRNTRAYAKRQITWFKADKEIIWTDPKDFAEHKKQSLQFLG